MSTTTWLPGYNWNHDLITDSNDGPNKSFVRTVTSSRGYTNTGVTCYRSTYSNKDWELNIRKRLDASSPYEKRELFFQPSRWSFNGRYFRQDWYPYPREVTQSGLRYQLPPLPLIGQGTTDAQTRDMALAKLKRKIASDVKQFESLVPLAEIHDLRASIRTLTAMTIGVVETLVALRRGKLPFRKVASIAANAWLTYSFGAKPLLKDIDDANEAISAYLTREDFMARYTASHTRDWTSGSTAGLGAQGSIFQGYCDWNVRHEIRYRFIAGFRFLLKSANDYGVAKHFGFELPQLVPAFWNTMAFSWIFDYFTTAGDFLEDTFSGDLGQSIYVVENRKYSANGTGSLRFVPLDPTYWRSYAASGSNPEFQYFEFQRSIHAKVPSRIIRFRSSDEIGRNAVNKLLNLASLLIK